MQTQISKTQNYPNKWEIVPVHTSDRGHFKACRRHWGWSSPSQLNLVPKTSVHGVREALWFGTGIHYALEKYYNPALREDPEIVFETWFNLEWNGGLVTEEEVRTYLDREPERYGGQHSATMLGNKIDPDQPIFKIKGLVDLLPNPDEEKFKDYLDLGKGMMHFYKDWAPRNDDFRVIDTEREFSVPVMNPKTHKALKVKDNRVMPEGYEHLQGKTKEVHARGRIDLIIQKIENGRYGIIDFKTTSRLDDDYFRHLELDEQTSTYLSCGSLDGKLNGLEWDELEFIDYQAMLKAYPRKPTITSRGLPSLNRAEESTTAEMFAECIDQLGLRPLYDLDEKMQGYYTWLLELGDKRFVHRKLMWRNKAQRQNALNRLYYEAVDMLNDPVLYPNPRKEYSCLNCVFRVPCIQAEDGSDYRATLEDGYIPNWDR